MANKTAMAFTDPTLPTEKRVADLVSRMTLDEKISQMIHGAAEVERLGIPAYNWWNECLHGVARAGIATTFPQAIGLAATWDTKLMHQVATTISDEARAKHHDFLKHGVRDIYAGLTFWSPNINIFRDPRWGRGQETYGEDPYLTGRMGVAFVKGLQGDDARYLKLVATAKHYAVHSGPESERHRFDARVSERDLRETYLPAFEALIKEAKVYSVMGAYNRTNGEACNASPTLLEKILRKEWGFDGYVVSDCWAIRDLYQGHALVKTVEEAAALAVKAGCDLNCGEAFLALRDAVRQGLIGEQAIDQALTRLFTARMKLGMFDPPDVNPYAQVPITVNGSPEHRALSLQAARESIVLLKNEKEILPLRKDISSIAVIGPNADDVAVLLGNYNGTPSRAVTPLEGIRSKVSAATKVYYAHGCDLVKGVPVLSVIPPANLRPATGGRGQTGLSAIYVANATFSGDAALERVDALVDFCWSNASPLGGLPTDDFSVHWSGWLIPPVSGDYALGVKGCSGYALYIDGKDVIPYAHNIHHTFTRACRLTLEAGRLYNIRLDFMSDGREPQVQLLWALPGMDEEAAALEAAARAEVVVMVMGLSANLEGEEMDVQVEGFSGGDRTDIALPRVQEDLLRKVHDLGKPVVLLLLNGSALAVNWASAHVPAILEAWYPGEAGGAAIADVLFGDYNPAGRLPVTFYTSVEQLPPFTDYNMAGHTYRYFDGHPLFPFGYGLSYTHFEYSNMRLETAHIARDGQAQVSIEVKNAGKIAGDEVVQLYVRYPDSRVTRPLKDLKGFARVSLAAGESKVVTFTLAANQLAYYETDRFVVEPGAVEVMVGGSSVDIRATARLLVV